MNPAAAPEPSQTHLRRRRLLFCLGALIVLATAFFCAKPAYRQFKAWRARRLAAESALRLDQNDFTQAQARAHAALLLAPGEPTALRAMAQVLTRTTNPAAVQFWQQLVLTGRATETDRRAFVAQAIRAGALSSAVQELQQLLSAAPEQPDNLWLASQVFLALGDRAQTLAYAVRAQHNNPTNLQYQLFLSSIQFDAPQTGERDAARSNLWSLARDRSAVGLEAVGFLARRTDLTATQREELISLLGAHPASGVGEELLSLDLQMQAVPDRRTEILDRAAARYKTAPPETRIQFAVWLNQRGEFQRTLQALPLEEAVKRKDFFLPHVDALASLGRWNELQKLFEKKQTPLEEVFAEAFRARCELQLTNATIAAFHWKSALRAAERVPEQLMWLASYATKCNEFETAKKTLRSLISCVENTRPAYQELERITERSGTTAELRDVLGEMVQHWPKDAAVRNDYAYLNALLGQNLAESRQAAEDLVKQFPDSLAHRTTLALVLLKQGEATAALKVYDGREYEWPRALPAHRVVFAAVLAANSRKTDAVKIAGPLPRESLRREELALIETLP